MANVTLVNYRTGATQTVDQSLIASFFFIDPAWAIQTDAPSAGANPDSRSVNGTVGESWKDSWNEELLTLSTVGLTTDSAGFLLPANSQILSVDTYVATAITTTTNWAVGDATTPARFSAANSSLTKGTSQVGNKHLDGGVAAGAGQMQTAAAKVRITCTGSNPGAGAVRIVVAYRTFNPPTV